MPHLVRQRTKLGRHQDLGYCFSFNLSCTWMAFPWASPRDRRKCTLFLAIAGTKESGGQGLLGKLKHLLGGGGRGCLGTYACSKRTSMGFFRGPPLDVSFPAYTRLVVLTQLCLPMLGLGLGQGRTIALHKAISHWSSFTIQNVKQHNVGFT